MKKYKGKWENSFIRYIFYAYEHTIGSKTCCFNCQIFNKMFDEQGGLNDFPYIGKDKIHIDKIKKSCNYFCIYYY